MKKIIFYLFLIFIFVSSTNKKETIIYVSNSGNDSWTGKLAEANKDKTDGPFATLSKAKDVVRILKAKDNSTAITVFIRGGIYPFSRALRFDEKDSGSVSAPVRWSAFKDEEVHFIGGKVVNNFEPVKDKAILNRLCKECQNKILQADLKKQGITEFEPISSGGWTKSHIGTELFFKGKPMQLARYPNKEWLRIADVPQTGEKKLNEGCFHTSRYGVLVGSHYGRFDYSGNRPSHWKSFDDIWMQGYWTWDWADEYMKIAKIDTLKHEIYPAEPHHTYGYSKNQRFYFVNILEELDSPREYYIDRNKGILYFFPPAPISKGDAMISVLKEEMILMENTSNISFEKIIFECSQHNPVKIKGGRNCKIAGCTVRNIGDDGIVIEEGKNNGVLSCNIYNVEAGISVSGGNRKTLTPAGNYAINNDIHDYSRINRTYRCGINVSGVGNIISHNHVHRSPHSGVIFWGNENLLEYNEVDSIAMETGDVGAFYIGRDWTMRGNKIQYNYFHHLFGPGEYGVNAVYLDDWASGTTIYGNVFYKAGHAAFIGGGRDNIVENNVFVDCQPSVHIDARGVGWAKYYFDGRDSTLFKRMKEVNYDKPPYSLKYPELLKYYSDQPELPLHNKIFNNISYNGKFIEILDNVDFDMVEVKNNLITDSILCIWYSRNWEFEHDEKEMIDILQKRGNIIAYKDPGFIDAKKLNFNPAKDSKALQLGFKPIPIDKIGLYTDEYRKKLKK